MLNNKNEGLGIEGANLILDKVICYSCQEACEKYLNELQYRKDLNIPDINKLYLTKQSGIYFPTHLCERVSPEEVATASKALIDMVCFCNAHHL